MRNPFFRRRSKQEHMQLTAARKLVWGDQVFGMGDGGLPPIITGELVEIPLINIESDQWCVRRTRVSELARLTTSAPPIHTVQLDNRTIILDGNHRVVVAHEQQLTTIRGYVYQ